MEKRSAYEGATRTEVELKTDHEQPPDERRSDRAGKDKTYESVIDPTQVTRADPSERSEECAYNIEKRANGIFKFCKKSTDGEHI